MATLAASPVGPWALASPAMRQIGGRIWLGAAIGFIAGTVAGLVLAVAFHQHAYAFWGFLLGGTIFGTILGGFRRWHVEPRVPRSRARARRPPIVGHGASSSTF